MKKHLILSVLLLISFPLFSLEKGEYWQIVNQVWQSKDYKKGINALKMAIKEYKDEPGFYSNLIHFYVGNKDYKIAYEFSLAAYDKFPNDEKTEGAVVSAHSNYGWSINRKDNKQEVYKVFAGQYNKYPHNKWSIRNYGHILWNIGKGREAVEILEEGIRRYPDMENMHQNCVWAHWYYGEDLLKENKPWKAYHHFKKAYKKGMKYYDYMAKNYIYKLMQLNRYEEAEKIIKAHPVIPDDKLKGIMTTLSWNYYGYADELFKNKQKQEAYQYYRKAYEKGKKYDIRAPISFIYKLLTFKKFREAESVLREHLKEISEEKLKNILITFAWEYYNYAEKLLKKGKKEKAYSYYRKSYLKAGKYDHRIPGVYLYKLMDFKKFDEAENVLREAKKNHGNTVYYEQEYWLIHRIGHDAKDNGRYKRSIVYLTKLYKHAKTGDRVWKDDMTFSGLAVQNIKHVLYNIVTVVEYWKKFTPTQRKLAYSYLKLFRKNLPRDLDFIYHDFYGAVLYRDNKIKKARTKLAKSYNLLLKSSFLKEAPKKMTMPFVLKGVYCAGGNDSSKAITHMGLYKYCYDIFGCNRKGYNKIPGTDGKSNEKYYGYGDIIYAPVSGTVINALDKHQDAKPSPVVTGKGNHLVKNEKPNLISLDITMPNETGVRMLKNLHDDPQTTNIPVVIVSGVDPQFKDFIEKRKQVNPPAAYFEKPIEREEYVKEIKSILKV